MTAELIVHSKRAEQVKNQKIQLNPRQSQTNSLRKPIILNTFLSMHMQGEKWYSLRILLSKHG